MLCPRLSLALSRSVFYRVIEFGEGFSVRCCFPSSLPFSPRYLLSFSCLIYPCRHGSHIFMFLYNLVSSIPLFPFILPAILLVYSVFSRLIFPSPSQYKSLLTRFHPLPPAIFQYWLKPLQKSISVTPNFLMKSQLHIHHPNSVVITRPLPHHPRSFFMTITTSPLSCSTLSSPSPLLLNTLAPHLLY